MTTTETTPGRAAYEAGGLGPHDTPWDALAARDRRVWDEAAAAAIDASPIAAARDEYRDNGILHIRERDQARADLAGAGELIRQLERITTAWTRGMYSAWIDCWRGDVKAAIECLAEGLDGYDGTEWDGTETGAEWWERTKAEEGL